MQQYALIIDDTCSERDKAKVAGSVEDGKSQFAKSEQYTWQLDFDDIYALMCI